MLGFGVAGIATLTVSGLYYFQNKLVYPSWAQGARDFVETPDTHDLPYESVTLITEDGEKLDAWDLKNSESRSTVLILCPNAGNMGYFIPIIDVFYRLFNTSVFIYSYRGYGHSTGTPSEAGLKIDAHCVMKHLLSDSFHKDRKLILFGRSLGGCNAIYIASQYRQAVSCVLLENTLLNIRKVIPHVFPWLRYVAFLCHEIWDSEKYILNCNPETPFLFLSGKKDEIVPPEHMERLFNLCPTTNKKIFEFNNGYHNDTIVQPGYWDLVKGFLDENNLI